MDSDTDLIFLRAGITELINSTDDVDFLDLIYKLLVAERCSPGIEERERAGIGACSFLL